MKKNLIKILLILIIGFSTSYADESFSGVVLPDLNSASEEIEEDREKTIKELKENIDNLDEETDNLKDKLDLLNADSKLEEFLRDNLTDIEISEIKIIYYKYRAEYFQLNKNLLEESTKLEDTTSIENQLLNKKKNLYKNLISYIKNEELTKYLEYIKFDAEISKKQKDISADINRKKVILEEKVETIQEKIIAHNKVLDEKINKVIKDKVETKIDEIDKKFYKVSNETKKIVFSKTITKVETKIINLENEEINSDANKKKINMYNIVLDKLREVVSGL